MGHKRWAPSCKPDLVCMHVVSHGVSWAHSNCQGHAFSQLHVPHALDSCLVNLVTYRLPLAVFCFKLLGSTSFEF